MFSVATIFLVAFALNLQDASSQSSVYYSIFPSSTTSANASALNITTNSSTKTTSVTTDSSTPTTNVTTSTSGTSSETTNTTATTSPPSVTITQSTATPPSGEKKKTCALVSATLDKKKPENLQQFLERFYFNDTEKYTDVEIKNLTKEGDDISFDVRLNFSGTEYFEGVAVKLLQDTLEASNVKVKVKGVKLTKWEAADGECDKCSNAGGPFDIRRECTEVECSCKGVKTTDQSEDCDKYNCHSTESGAVSFMVSYLLVAMAIALSLSFYL